METFVILLVGLLVLDVAAWRWGFDSRDGWKSAEWERRRSWRAFSLNDPKGMFQSKDRSEK